MSVKLRLIPTVPARVTGRERRLLAIERLLIRDPNLSNRQIRAQLQCGVGEMMLARENLGIDVSSRWGRAEATVDRVQFTGRIGQLWLDGKLCEGE